MRLTAVELDKNVVSVAMSYFGFCEDERMKICIGDGLAVSSNRNNNDENYEKTDQRSDRILFDHSSLSLIVIDLDSKDATVGMSTLPIAFVNTSYLNELNDILNDNGVLAINVAARDPTMFDLVKKNLTETFFSVFAPGVHSNNDRDEVNVVLFARKKKRVKFYQRYSSRIA